MHAAHASVRNDCQVRRSDLPWRPAGGARALGDRARLNAEPPSPPEQPSGANFFANDAAIGQPSQRGLHVRATDVVVSGRRRPITPKTAEQPSAITVDLVGLAEAAELAGIGRAALSLRRQQHTNFPKPVAEPRCGPIWFRWQIETYLHEERRLGRRGWYGLRVRTGR
jgi:hypothetical protein